MDLSKLSIEPRLRNGWQAIDLGFVMARRWWWTCFLVWAIPFATVFCILTLVLYSRPWLVAILVWWSKPLWDRLPLLVASRALFGESPQLWPTLRKLPSILKTDWVAALTHRRLSPSRSFDLPVTVLEGLRKEARSQRLIVLHQSYGSAATLLTLVCVHVELFVASGILLAGAYLLPPELNQDPQAFFFTSSLAAQHAANFVMCAAMALVAPFYCLAGFSLYIHRRIQLEGWDIEIRFRHLLERHKTTKKHSRVAACFLPFILGGLFLFNASEGWASESDSAAFLQGYYQGLSNHDMAGDSKQDIIQVLSGPDFLQVEMERGWRFKDSEPTENHFDFINSLLEMIEKWHRLTESLGDSMRGLASFFEFMVWAFLGALLVYIIYRYRRGMLKIFQFTSSPPVKNTQPELLFGLDVRKESLPNNVCEQVLHLWDQGKEREALALLYRATLSRLIHQFSFEFYLGFTEQECVEVVEQSNESALSHYLRQLTGIWQRLAYAHHIPPRQQVASLCSDWQSLFDREGLGEVKGGA